MKKLLIVIFCLTIGCGYQPIYQGKNTSDFVFRDIQLNGNNKVNRKIISFINFKEDNQNYNLNEIILNTSKKIEETSKDSKGQILSYRTTINLDLTIKNNDKIIKSKIFSKNFSYNNMSNKFDLAKYQDEVENNIIKKIIEDVIIYLNL